jgi:hypothetical protein
MSWMPIGADHWPHGRSSADKQPTADIPRNLLWAGFALRTVFIVAMLVVIVHVALPQRASFWTLFETPGDIIRVALGAAACVWITVQVFAMPRDIHTFRTWAYLGLAAVPFALICIFGIW